MTGTQAYILSKGYTNKSILGISGVLAGKNCTIDSITPSPDGTYNTVVFKWTADDGTTRTSSMQVMNGTIAEVQSYLTEGIKIATIIVNNRPVDIYAPEGGSGDDDYGIVENIVDLPADLTPDDRKIYYVIEDQHSYLWDGTKWEMIRSDAKVMELTQAEYDALTPAEKMNGTIYFVTDGGGSGGGSAELTDDLTTTKAVGGINVGKFYPVETSLEVILRDMLAPTLYPTFTNPSASISATGAKLLESGSTLNTTITATLNRGTISPAYGTSGYRAGAATGYSLNGDTAQAGNTFNVTVTSAQLTYQVNITYAEGEQPKDSVGNNYSTPLPAGSVNSNTITYEFVDALWSNQSNIATIAKMSLVSKSAKQKDMVFPAQTVANPEVFDVPASWTVTAVQVKNDLSGAYEDALSQFTVTNVTHNNAAGDSVNYKRYTFNLGYDTGSRTVRLKWS